MRTSSFSFRPLLIGGLVLGVAILACASPSVNAQTKKKPAPAKSQNTQKAPAPAPDPPGTTLILGRLHAWFKKYANADGNWGKEEVARAYGYQHPYDWVLPPPEGKEDDANSAVSDPSSVKSAGATRQSKRNYWRKDKILMDALDLDGDEIISKEEFDAWAHDYAVEKAKQYQQVKNAVALQQQAMMLQMKAMQASLQRYQNANRGRYNRGRGRRR